jgi:acetyltransferase-like isoleucine patch superfamily enzyme
MSSNIQKQILIIGSGAIFEEVFQLAASSPGLTVERLEAHAPDPSTFELPDLATYPPAEWQMLVALDDRGLNLSRTQLVAALKGRGYKLHRLVAPDAHVSPAAVMGENAIVMPGATISGTTKLGLNVFVGAGARIADGCKIGNGAYLDVGCILGRGVELGDYVSVGVAAMIHAGSKIGRYCELRQAQAYRGQIPDKTFYFDRFQNPVSIIAPV